MSAPTPTQPQPQPNKTGRLFMSALASGLITWLAFSAAFVPEVVRIFCVVCTFVCVLAWITAFDADTKRAKRQEQLRRKARKQAQARAQGDRR